MQTIQSNLNKTKTAHMPLQFITYVKERGPKTDRLTLIGRGRRVPSRAVSGAPSRLFRFGEAVSTAPPQGPQEEIVA